MTTLIWSEAAQLVRLRTIIAHAAHVSPDSFGPDDDLLATAGLDSLTILRVVAGVEREFGVVIPDAALHQLRTLNDISRCIRIRT